MPTNTAKTLVAGALILVAGLVCLLARPVAAAEPALPAMAPVLAAAGLQVHAVGAPGDAGGPYREWTVQQRDGQQALLFVQATREPQRVIGWSGQLGYQGAGYETSQLRVGPLRASDGASGTATTSYLQAPGQFLAMAATNLGPAGFDSGGPAATSRLLLDEVLGERSLWYLVRIAIPSQALGEPTTEQAAALLAAVLPVLAQERGIPA